MTDWCPVTIPLTLNGCYGRCTISIILCHERPGDQDREPYDQEEEPATDLPCATYVNWDPDQTISNMLGGDQETSSLLGSDGQSDTDSSKTFTPNDAHLTDPHSEVDVGFNIPERHQLPPTQTCRALRKARLIAWF